MTGGVLSKDGPVDDLVTNKTYGNFELELEWKIGREGNSGVFYRGTREYDHVYWSAPEYQLLDDANTEDGKSPLTAAGSDYALYGVPPGVAKPFDQWNKTRLVVKGNHVEHWLNGVKVVEYDFGSADWKQRVAASKFAKYPHYGLAKRGPDRPAGRSPRGARDPQHPHSRAAVVSMAVALADSMRRISGLLQSGQYGAAHAQLESLVAANPDYVEGLRLLAGTKQALGDSAQAESLLRRALEIDPRSAPALTTLAELLLLSGRSAEAVPLLRRAIQGTPPYPRLSATVGSPLPGHGPAGPGARGRGSLVR